MSNIIRFGGGKDVLMGTMVAADLVIGKTGYSNDSKILITGTKPPFIAGNIPLISVVSRVSTVSNTYVKLREFNIPVIGNYRLSYTLKSPVGGTSYISYGKVFKNGVDISGEQTNSRGFDFTTTAINDTIAIYVHKDSSAPDMEIYSCFIGISGPTTLPTLTL